MVIMSVEDPTLMDSNSCRGTSHYQFSFLKQYLYSFIVSFGCVCAGTVLAWTSSVLPHITKQMTNSTETIDNETFQISETHAGFVGSIVAIGAICGALPAGFIAKKLGIKLLFLTIALLFVLGWSGTLYHSLETILLGRFVGGIATGAVCVCVPIYVSEIASLEIRGILGSFFQVSFCFGILLVNLIGGFVHWSHLTYWMIACPFIYFFMLTRIPSLNLQTSAGNLEKPSNKKTSLWDEVLKRNNLKALIVGLGLVSCQQLSGINAVIFYTGSIFTAAGSTMSPSLSTVIVTAVQLIISVISAMCIERFNRRLFLLISASGMALSVIVLGIYFISKPALPGIVPLVSLIFYFFCFCAGYGPLPWLMLGEIFSSEFKSTGCSIATTFNWLLVFMVTSVFPILCSQLGEGWTFFLFGGFNIFAIVFTYIWVPETRGKTSEDIQMNFSR